MLYYVFFFLSLGVLVKSNFNVHYCFACALLYVKSRALVANEAFLQKCPSNKLTTGHLQRTQDDRSPAEQSAYALVHENENRQAFHRVAKQL